MYVEYVQGNHLSVPMSDYDNEVDWRLLSRRTTWSLFLVRGEPSQRVSRHRRHVVSSFLRPPHSESARNNYQNVTNIVAVLIF